MTATDQYIPVPESSQDSDASIVAMLDEILAQDDLYIFAHSEGYRLCIAHNRDAQPYYEIIDSYETRSNAYRAAIDCLIEACVFAWDQGDES